jgi:hypothetical protein
MLLDNYGGKWCSRIYNLQNVVTVLGYDVLVQFCRSFIHADRLISFAHMYYLIRVLYHEGSVTRQRNFGTILWFVVGTLTELGTGLQNLRSVLRKRDLLDADSEGWRTLRRIEENWHRNPYYRQLRNTVAFHVDPDALERGLRKLAESKEPTFFVESDGKENYQVSLRLGRQALTAGLDLDPQHHGKLLTFIEECSVVPVALQQVFLGLVARAGGSVREASVAIHAKYGIAFKLDDA